MDLIYVNRKRIDDNRSAIVLGRYGGCDALDSSRARICLAIVRRSPVPLRALRYSSLLGLRTTSRRCSTSSRMIVTDVGLSSISTGTSLLHELLLRKRGQSQTAHRTPREVRIGSYPLSHHLRQIRTPRAANIFQAHRLFARAVGRGSIPPALETTRQMICRSGYSNQP